jgi:regulatory protein
VAGRLRGRTGRGWDAAPPRARSIGDKSTGGSFRGGGLRAGNSLGGGPSDDREETWENATPAKPRRSAETAETTEQTDPAERAREICLRQLAIRPRTRDELAKTLRQRGIATDIAAEVLDRYDEVGIIDDKAFARAWVTSRHHGRGLARRALAVELRRRGVDAEVVGAALDELDDDTEVQTARALVLRKLRTERVGQPDATFRRLVAMLARKGYAPGLAIQIVKQALAERAESARFAEAVDVDVLEAEALDGGGGPGDRGGRA